MRVRVSIQLDSDDEARVAVVEQVFQQIGGHSLPEDAQKMLGHFRANDFTMDDVDKLEALVAQAAKEPIPVVFADAKLQATWQAGYVQVRTLAVRDVRDFRERLDCDIAAWKARWTEGLSPAL